jgi:transcriptional regulator with XRE-family HTH domain
MEKTFLRMKKSPTARDAYVQAEVVTALAHQIRAIRMQRNWSQAELAKKMGTTQAAVSRLEDPSYGRLSIKTLLDLSRVFDTGLRVQFVSLVTMLHETFKPKAHLREVPSFEEEAPGVGFYTPGKNFIESNAVQPASVVMLSASAIALPLGRQTMRSFPMLPSNYLDEPFEIAQ